VDKLNKLARNEVTMTPQYPKAGNGRRSCPFTILRIHYMQLWYHFSDPDWAGALYENASMRLTGSCTFVLADARYLGTEEQVEPKQHQADWHIAEQPRRLKALKQHPRIDKVRIQTEYLKASIRAKVEHPFRIVKCQFGFVKARYRGLKKNDGKQAGECSLRWPTLFGWTSVESVGLIRMYCL
jgi:hypothetical protein